jgi:hypothetical protein
MALHRATNGTDSGLPVIVAVNTALSSPLGVSTLTGCILWLYPLSNVPPSNSATTFTSSQLASAAASPL